MNDFMASLAPPVTAVAGTAKPSLITAEQSEQMQTLAARMADPAGKAYLIQKAASPIPYAEADEIIRRATASLGGN